MHVPICGVDANKKGKRRYCNDERRRMASGHKVRKSCDYQKCVVCYYEWAFAWQLRSTNAGKSMINDINGGCIEKCMQDE